MTIIEANSQNWCIDENVGRAYYEALQRNDFASIRAALRDKEQKSDFLSIVDNQLAILSINGVILKNGGMCAYGTIDYMAALEEIKDNNNIHTLILDIDSGGGTVAGTETFANYLSEYPKKVVAFVSDMCASAAYWIASSAEEIYISGESASVGSIGTMTVRSKRDETETVIFANESFNKEKTDKKAKEWVTKLNQSFVNSVKKNRAQNENFQKAMSNIAKNGDIEIPLVLSGEVFVGSEIIENGLADAVISLEKLVGSILNQRVVNNSKSNSYMLSFIKSAFANWKAKGLLANDATAETLAQEATESDFFASFQSEMNKAIEPMNAKIEALQNQTEQIKVLSDEIAQLKKGAKLMQTTQTSTLQDEFEKKLQGVVTINLK